MTSVVVLMLLLCFDVIFSLDSNGGCSSPSEVTFLGSFLYDLFE